MATIHPGVNNSAYPTVATIIGCPEQLTSTNGLVATPIGASGELQPPVGPYIEDTSLIKDPIQKALIDNICGKLPTKHTPELIKCDICNIYCNNNVAFQSHLNGTKHSKKLKADGMLDVTKLPFIKYHKESRSYSCTLCCATMNAISQISPHIEGQKHKNKAQSIDPLEKSNKQINSDPAKPRVDATPNLLYCAACNIHVNSQVQFEQHSLSRKHINRVNGRGVRDVGSSGPAWRWKNRNMGAGRGQLLPGERRSSSLTILPKITNSFIHGGQFRPY